ncbi:protease [Lithospermum erythrorhizon]|uniref:Protease n=1 Tax=Lithospermum erythrorhizon TaxID=34254 RepID=A0AAV3NU93_LITER
MNQKSNMNSGRKSTFGKVRSLIGNSMGGLRGGSNLASWVVAGTLAYFLWVKPSQQLPLEQQEKAMAAATDPNRYIEKRKPVPDPQETGLKYGDKNRESKSQDKE